MSAWWLDRVVPGLVVALISAPLALLLQHRAFTRKIRDVTSEQTAELKRHLGGGEDGT